MLTELRAWFADQLPNRRLYPRRPGPFRAWLAEGEELHPVIGTDIAASGIGVMSLEPLPWGAVSFAAEIRGERISFHGYSVWVQEGTLEEKRVWRGGFRMGAIDAQGWRSILDFCNAALPATEQVGEPPLVRIPADDAERLLPHALRERIAAMLANANRVTFLGTHPNLQYAYGGVVHFEGSARHRLCVYSNAVDKDNRVHANETVFYFSDDLRSVSMDAGDGIAEEAAS